MSSVTATTPPEQDAQPAAAAAPAERRVYAASGLRKTVLSVLFLLLLPFVASLPAMAWQRVSNGLWHDFGAFLLVAVATIAVMGLLVHHLLLSLRAKLEIGARAVRFTLPARGGLVPAFSFATHEIPYNQIDAVELRREIYGGRLAPVMLRGARIIAKDGQTFPLGYVSEANVDPAFPFPAIAAQIAERAGVPIVDRGNVRRSVHKKVLGIRAMDDGMAAITEDDIAVLNRAHRRAVLAIIGVMTALLAVGLSQDLMRSELDQGERAANAQPPIMPASGKKK